MGEKRYAKLTSSETIYDLMEEHYAAEHAALIERLAGGARVV